METHNDPWFGTDKLAHLLGSICLVVIIAALLQGWLGDGLSLLIAALATLTIGIIKEAWDVTHGGWFSLKDLTADGVGIVLAILLIVL